jgi:hypothetical protein
VKFATKSADTFNDCDATARSRAVDGARQGLRTTDLDNQVHAAVFGQALDVFLPFRIAPMVSLGWSNQPDQLVTLSS